MDLRRVNKILIFVLFFVVLLLFWLMSHHCSVPATTTIVETRLLRAQPDSQSNALLDMLRRTSMPDASVIMTIVNLAWAKPESILDLFLESFWTGEGTEYLLNHLVIITLDNQSLQYCKTVHPHCFALRNPRRISKSINPDGPDLSWSVKELLRKVIEVGYSVFFTEADVMWLKNPLEHVNPSSELSIACDQQEDPRADGGFFYMKANERSLELLKILNMERILHPASQDQSFCQIVKRKDLAELLGLQITHLSEANFGGFCNPGWDSSKLSTVHANCCYDTNTRVHDLKLLLEDWRNVTAEGSSTLWRSSKCIV